MLSPDASIAKRDLAVLSTGQPCCGQVRVCLPARRAVGHVLQSAASGELGPHDRGEARDHGIPGGDIPVPIEREFPHDLSMLPSWPCHNHTGTGSVLSLLLNCRRARPGA